jgi:hypothetical protein
METTEKRDPRGQGERGERNAAVWFLEQGMSVFVPVLHTPRDFDLIADLDGQVSRIQVKTSTQYLDDRWRVAICTRGGNRSWSGVVKYPDPTRYDFLFALVADGRRWLIPSAQIGARMSISLGGSKYSRYEIERGAPL